MLPKAEFAFPGPLRDRLVAAILDGSKTATTGLLTEYEHDGERLPCDGHLATLVSLCTTPPRSFWSASVLLPAFTACADQSLLHPTVVTE